MLKIGVNTPLLKESIVEIGIYETMRKVSDMGYHYIEISQIALSPENVKEFKRAQDDFGVQVCSVSVDVEPQPLTPDRVRKMNVNDDFDQIIEACKTLGCKHARTFLIGTDDFSSEDNIKSFAARMDAAAKKLGTEGIDYSYHPHNYEYAKHNGKVGMRIMKDSSETLKFELCTYWIQAGGLDSERLIREFGKNGRISILHLKDYRIAPITGDMFNLNASNGATLLRDIVQFAEAGEGNLDIPGIIQAGDDVGAEYIFLEQDQHYGRSEFEILQTDYDNLCAMGYKDRM